MSGISYVSPHFLPDRIVDQHRSTHSPKFTPHLESKTSKHVIRSVEIAGFAEGNEGDGNRWLHTDKGNCVKSWDRHAIYKGRIPQEV